MYVGRYVGRYVGPLPPSGTAAVFSACAESSGTFIVVGSVLLDVLVLLEAGVDLE